MLQQPHNPSNQQLTQGELTQSPLSHNTLPQHLSQSPLYQQTHNAPPSTQKQLSKQQSKSFRNLLGEQPQQQMKVQPTYKNLLAERPQNHQQYQSSQKLPPVKGEVEGTSKTSQNFYVSSNVAKNLKKSKPGTRNSQKILLARSSTKQQQPSSMNPSSPQITDITVLLLLHKVITRMRLRGDDMTLECLINEQKLIHIAMTFLQKKIITPQSLQAIFSLQKQIIAFVQKINKVTMENFKQEDHNIDVKIFSKAVDLLMTPNMGRFVKDLKTLGKVKVLTFNNLACIYKKKKMFGIALRSVSFALQIEQALLNSQTNEQKYDIIPTYLNKAAILSQMNKHQKAIDQIQKSQKFIQKIEKQVIKQITQAQANFNQQMKKRLQQKRYYGLYMKMIINYNMGAEKEHMKMVEAACEYYKQGRQLALLINNQFMVRKFQEILGKIMMVGEGRQR